MMDMRIRIEGGYELQTFICGLDMKPWAIWQDSKCIYDGRVKYE
jgi:hypothetical protein